MERQRIREYLFYIRKVRTDMGTGCRIAKQVSTPYRDNINVKKN